MLQFKPSSNQSLDVLDTILKETILYLKNTWINNPDTGIVACCLLDGDKKVFATSSRNGNYWRHAERNAYYQFKKRYGEPSRDAVFVITLSPCIKALKARAQDEAACANLINDLGVKRIHFGVLDTLHAETLSTYSSLGFKPSLSQDHYCKTMCEKLMAIFTTYQSRISKDLLGIKRELGEAFFNSTSQEVVANQAFLTKI
ncbi:Pyrimidine deaminase [Legionella busanensis]|uniref:Pyrimidine deaminase n=2 Tax=Legionella busanensis TaxID=190655 RepID=A0A378JLG2_9GAMM|nr:Pyrimidine deaminase [Legionella busanensis]